MTATKTGAADVQSTPVAVTALPGRTLEQMGVQTVEGLAGFVPSVTSRSTPGLRRSPSAVSAPTARSSAPIPSSTVHLDGVYLGRPVMVFAELPGRRTRRGPAGATRDALRAQLRRRHDQHRHQAADQRARHQRTAHRRQLRQAARRRRRQRAADQEQGDGQLRVSAGSRAGFVNDFDHPDHSLGSEDTWAGRGQLRVVFGNRNDLLLSGDYGRFKAFRSPMPSRLRRRPLR